MEDLRTPSGDSTSGWRHLLPLPVGLVSSRKTLKVDWTDESQIGPSPVGPIFCVNQRK